MKKKNFWKGLTSIVSTVSGAGIGYIVAQCGSIAYIATREMVNIVTGQPLASLPELLRDYAIYTSAAAAIGEVGGYVFYKKIWKVLGGE
ncbi:MAG: hypothetical protein QW040_01225 [Candidatus Aenigmatarchaeota archaeon]